MSDEGFWLCLPIQNNTHDHHPSIITDVVVQLSCVAKTLFFSPSSITFAVY
jgi:hypothetical protein